MKKGRDNGHQYLETSPGGALMTSAPSGIFVDDLTFARMTAEEAFREELAALDSRTSDNGSGLLDKWYRLCAAGQAEVAALERRLEKARAAQIENANAARDEIDTALSNQAIADARRTREWESEG